MFSQSQSFNGKSMVPSFLPEGIRLNQLQTEEENSADVISYSACISACQDGLPWWDMVTMVTKGWAKIQRGYIPQSGICLGINRWNYDELMWIYDICNFQRIPYSWGRHAVI